MHASKMTTRISALLTSFVAAVEIAFFRVACMQSYDGFTDPNGMAGDLFSLGTVAVIIVLTAVLTVASLLFMRKDDRIFHWCFKYRYVIAALLLVILVVCRVSGTSIGMLTNLLGGEAGDYLGVPRNIRRDEWVVNTPLALSQAYSGYSSVSSLASGGGLDLTLVYAQPCWDFSTLFRPFLWGYLLLPSEYGLSFFWCGRLVCLFMVSFEFGRFITDDRRRIALVYAIFITFSPLVQWWFAVNSVAEMLIFSQLFILLFRGFLAKSTLRPMLLHALGIAYCAAAFVLGLYPAWQVLLVYVMFAACLVLLIRYLRSAPGKRDILIHALVFITAIACAVVAVLLVVMSSYGTITAVTSSEYPGSRLETGGGLFNYLFAYALVLVAPIDPTPILPNACEKAGMFSLFPLGIILGIVAVYKKRDGIVIALLVVEALFLLFGIIGFPAPLAKVLLLSNVTPQRLVFGTGVIDIILLCRGMSLLSRIFDGAHADGREESRLAPAALVALFVFAGALLGGIAVHCASVSSMPTMRLLVKVFTALFIALSVFTVLRVCFARDDKQHPLLCVAALVMLTGLMVNPVQLGLSRFDETPLATAIEQQVQEDAGNDDGSLWVADDSIIAQACIAYGVPTLNSVALYPHIDVWEPIDSEGKFKEVYNRYAHVKIQPTSGELEFELTVADGFTVHLDTASIKTLGISNWVSKDDLTQFSDDIVHFELAKDAGPYKVYRVVSS